MVERLREFLELDVCVLGEFLLTRSLFIHDCDNFALGSYTKNLTAKELFERSGI